ncbi:MULTISPECIES: hypothetical protein [unclassified Rickettsia]|uniref:hypothetical protein n=1 Tax=unclassified Rickettsia TaxID=114295 RepID=UPI00313346C3
MNSLETRILGFGKNTDINFQNILNQIEEIKKLIGEIPPNAKLIREYNDEDDEDDFDDGIWIEFPFTGKK